MKESSFQFKTPTLKNIIFQTNNFQKDTSLIDISNELTVNIEKHETEPFATVDLAIKIGSIGSDSPFYIEMTLGSEFKWDENAYDEATIEALLKTNAPALLLSYARPIIANITNSSKYPVYNIPLIDFTQHNNK